MVIGGGVSDRAAHGSRKGLCDVEVELQGDRAFRQAMLAAIASCSRPVSTRSRDFTTKSSISLALGGEGR